MDRISKPTSNLDMNVLCALFPRVDVSSLQRENETIYILLGNDYFGLHPKCEIAKAGKNLSVMEGLLGRCLQGSHPALKATSSLSSHYIKSVLDIRPEQFCNLVKFSSNREFKQPIIANFTNTSKQNVNAFIESEELATKVNQQCGSCKCGKCPLLGHNYSFKEKSELQLIRTSGMIKTWRNGLLNIR